MCGILAISKTSASSLDRAGQALHMLSRRGPDDKGIFENEGIILGHTRLSIIDLGSGHQPMTDNTLPYTVVFNGEIYNYRELRTRLEKKGYYFSTNSDTEVLLKAYAEYGEKCPDHLDGMFAFALWDAKKKELFLARDRFGKKPLYYAFTDTGDIVAASEIKAILALGIKGRLDPEAIDEYLTLMYVPPWRTIYTNVYVLPPAHKALFKDGKINTERYWTLLRKPISISYGDAKEEVRRLFTEAVKKRMIADVEIGSFLSGGLDSTLVTSYAQRFADHPLKTFSLGYGEHINELPFAKEAAKKIGTEHHTLQASADNITQELECALEYFDEPHGDSADFPQHLVSGLAASKVKVALSGDGGDELFLGYGWYWAYWNARKLSQLKNFFLSNPYQEHLRNITVFPTSLRRKFWKNTSNLSRENIGKLTEGFPGKDVEKMNYFDIMTYLPGQLLSKVDQMSMMHSLEVRCPFLDHALAEFAFNLPEKYKTDRTTGKIILKELLREFMPDSFVDRKKQGFGAPVRKWFADPRLRAYTKRMFSPGAIVYSFLDETTVSRFVSEIETRKDPRYFYRLWVLLCLEIWFRKHPGVIT